MIKQPLLVSCLPQFHYLLFLTMAIFCSKLRAIRFILTLDLELIVVGLVTMLGLRTRTTAWGCNEGQSMVTCVI